MEERRGGTVKSKSCNVWREPIFTVFLQTDENLLRKDLGNVTADTECTFSYAFRPKTQIDLSDINEVPFQVII